MYDKGREARSGRINLLVHPNGPGTHAPAVTGAGAAWEDMAAGWRRMPGNAG